MSPRKAPFKWEYKRGTFPRAGWPLHATKDFRKRLRGDATDLAAFYRGPVYLVGSALLDSNAQPRDWDVRITIPNAEFQRRYGDPNRWVEEGHTGQWTKVRWRWSDDCVKQSQRLSGHLQVLVDVQVYPQSFEGIFTGKPRLRLDRRRRDS